MKVLVGLGNPGPRYRNTRHNAGFMVIDALAERLGTRFGKEKYGGLVAETVRGGQTLMLLKPLTFMNLSGVSVAQATRNKIADFAADFLVVVDDVNLPLGRLRLRGGGSAGGHNGLKSLIEHLGTQEFARLRIGVGQTKPGDDLVDHVLSRFAPEEVPEVEKALARAADAVLCFVDEGLERAMNQFN